jgi:hypothetical protein
LLAEIGVDEAAFEKLVADGVVRSPAREGAE